MNKQLAIAIVLFLAFVSYASGQTAGSGISPADQPAVTKAVAPIYPAVAKAGLITDDVVVEGSVHPTGVFVTTTIVSGHKVFHKVVEDAARKWRFEPYTSPSDGKLRTARLTFLFRVMPADTPEAELLPIFYPPYKIEVRCVIGRII